MGGVYKRKDHYYDRAKAEGYRSRGAYKLLELNKKFKFLKPGATVLDLGSFPGGWLQVAQEKVGPRGVVVGVDLNEVEPVGVQDPGANAPVILRGDIREPEIQEQIRLLSGPGVDVLLSDMSPKLSGIRFRDAAFSAELVEIAFETAKSLLRPGGSFVAKIFPGQESEELVKKIRPAFERFSRENLDASRKSSTEMYFVGQSFKGQSKK